MFSIGKGTSKETLLRYTFHFDYELDINRYIGY